MRVKDLLPKLDPKSRYFVVVKRGRCLFGDMLRFGPYREYGVHKRGWTLWFEGQDGECWWAPVITPWDKGLKRAISVHRILKNGQVESVVL